jgi:hypothetical protein
MERRLPTATIPLYAHSSNASTRINVHQPNVAANPGVQVNVIVDSPKGLFSERVARKFKVVGVRSRYGARHLVGN